MNEHKQYANKHTCMSVCNIICMSVIDSAADAGESRHRGVCEKNTPPEKKCYQYYCSLGDFC